MRLFKRKFKVTFVSDEYWQGFVKGTTYQAEEVRGEGSTWFVFLTPNRGCFVEVNKCMFTVKQ